MGLKIRMRLNSKVGTFSRGWAEIHFDFTNENNYINNSEITIKLSMLTFRCIFLVDSEWGNHISNKAALS